MSLFTRKDYPRSGLQTFWQSGSPESVDSGQELINLAATGVYPAGTSPARSGNREGLQRDMPPRWYDIRGSRGVVIQISSFNVVGATQPVIQINASTDGMGVVPLSLLNPATGAYVTQYTIPLGGTAPTPAQMFGTGGQPNSLMIVIDAPWFQWIQVQVVTAATTSGSAYLTITRRE